MKRFHIHIAVADLAKNIAFYTKLFGQAPVKEKPDYAKWMLDDPAINFAISAKGNNTGINHLGVQVEDKQELAELKSLAEQASADDVYEEGLVTCCHAKSDKHWTRDPQGIAWEHYMTLGDVEQYGESRSMDSKGCCIPLSKDKPEASCCVTDDAPVNSTACCQ